MTLLCNHSRRACSIILGIAPRYIRTNTGLKPKQRITKIVLTGIKIGSDRFCVFWIGTNIFMNKLLGSSPTILFLTLFLHFLLTFTLWSYITSVICCMHKIVYYNIKCKVMSQGPHP